MRYQLDISNNVSESYLFWLNRFMQYKTDTLSSRNVTDRKKIENALIKLKTTPDTTEELGKTVRDIRKAGIEGIKGFYVPTEKLYHHIKEQKLDSMKSIDDEVVFSFLSHATAGMSAATQKNYRNAINNFFNYISKHNENNSGEGDGFIYHLDIKAWQSASLRGSSGTKTPDYLTDDEVRLFFESLSSYNFITDRSEVLYHLLTRMLFLTGFRIPELLSLEKRNITIQKERVEVWVVGKGNKERSSSIPLRALEPHLSQWKRLSSCTGKKFFCSVRNPNCDANPSSASHMIEKLLLHAGLAKRKRGAHLFRHTFGTQAYRKEKDLALVQDMMGHADPATTRVYTHIAREKHNTATDNLANMLL